MPLAKPTPGSAQAPAATKLADTTTAADDAGQSWEETPANISQPAAAASAGTDVSTHVRQSGPGVGNFDSLAGKVGYGSFPQTTLDKDMFKVGEFGDISSFDFHPWSSRNRYIYKADPKDRNSDFFFSYDQLETTQGEPVAAKLAEWRAAGFGAPGVKEYQELSGQILSADGHKTDNEQFVDMLTICSIPPTSVSRLSGVQARLEAGMYGGNDGKKRPLTLGECVFRIEKGEKITTKSKDTFYPWDFKFVGLKSEYGASDEAE